MTAATQRPNILLIMSDQHSRNYLGCYGNSLVRTPNLDRLAAGGKLFTGAYCPAPLCVPSRMSFMTSRSPSANQVWNNNHILGSGIPTWAHHLSLAGYETALLGRMHFCGPDQRHGFELRPVSEAHAGLVGAPVRGGPLWTRFPAATSGQCRASVEIAGRGKTHYQWSDEERTRVAVEWLRQRAAAQSRSPFAAVLGYTLPHCPFVAPRELFDYYYSRVEIPSVEAQQPDTVLRFRRLRGILDPPLAEERIRVARAAYYGLCEHLDSLVGQVLDTLEESGLAQNTVVLYTADHGEMAGEHGCWWKSMYYEGSAGVPLLVRWPGVIAPGSRSAAVCNLMDIGPTLLEIAGAGFPYLVDGASLCDILQHGDTADWENETYSELVDHRGGVYPSRMIRSGPWKLWEFVDADRLPPVLFNLEEDPGEEHDRWQDPACRQIGTLLRRRLHENWMPRQAAERSKTLWEYYATLQQYGSVVQPESAAAMVFPPSAYEDGVELL